MRTQSHAHRDICVRHHFRKFVEADLAVVVEVGFHDGFVDNLLRRAPLSASPLQLKSSLSLRVPQHGRTMDLSS